MPLSVSEWSSPSSPGVPLPASSAAPAAAAALAPGVTAYFEMNESSGTTVMHDSGPNSLAAPVDPTGVSSGVEFDGATGYTWARRAPEAWPPSPERGDPGSRQPQPRARATARFTIELRYGPRRTSATSARRARPTLQGRPVEDPGTRAASSPASSRGRCVQVATGKLTSVNDKRVAQPHSACSPRPA